MKIRELRRVSADKVGYLKKNDIRLEPHEEDTALYLTQYGFNIDVIKPNNTPKTNSPDFLVNGVIWEAKSPEGGGNSTIARHFHKASKQAGKMILDLRRIKRPAEKAEREAKYRFEKAKNIKQLMLITKDGKLFDISK
ncbi:hypothetical protein IKF84_03340 [Candidatus Saccharibacteria bacterium]|nr:hypothetical protein [Candidatus Saccharibacteria bacterium]